MGRRVTQQDHDDVKRLHAEGLSRNEIMRRTGRSGRTVSRIADEHGLSFERGEMVRAATEAKKIDAKAKRAALADKLLDDAERLRLQLWLPAHVYNFGGKENTYEEATIDRPTFADQRNIIQAISVAANASLKLDEYDRADGDLTGLDAWLAHMTGQDR